GQPRSAAPHRRPAGCDPASLRLAPARARLPARGTERRAPSRRAHRVPATGRAAGLRGTVDLAPARAGGDPGRARARDPAGTPAPRGGAAAARVLLPPDPRRGVLPRRPASGEHALGRRADLLPRLRHGRRALARDARPAAAPAACVLAGGRAVP